ncbi:hypothetical protein [Sorangium sp. So ce887]|uniref:hypothetical protein n=1 Tax=Sorangium sp. So ce887 TaxID=3133324 RepID=UPI003F601B97
MEAWNITKYESPYLAISGVRLDDATGEVLVTADVNEYVIEHGEGTAARDVVSRLDALREPGSKVWKEVLSASPDSDWRDLLQTMDYLGLLCDAAPEVKGRRDAEIAKLRGWISTCVEQVVTDVGPGGRQALLSHARTLRQHFLDLTLEFSRTLPLERPLPVTDTRPLSSPEILALDNFYQQIAMVQALYQRVQAPLSLVCCTQALLSLEVRLTSAQAGEVVLDELISELTGGSYSSPDAQRHLNGLAECLVSGTDPSRAKRFCVATYEPKECLTGIGFMLEVERVAREVTSRVGIPAYLKELSAPDADVILVHGRYLQDYHVTTRFPEIVAAILPKRLNATLRAKAFRYYAEEVGHDVLEYQSCRELGLSEEEIQSAQPLPLHFAYVDVFTQLGVLDPVAYVVSIFITEGVLGVDSPLDEPYKKLIGEFMALDKHILLNEKYHHTSIPRLFMSEVKTVSPAIQRLAMSYMLLVLELNYRAWDDLLDHYLRGDQRFLRVLPKVTIKRRKAA